VMMVVPYSLFERVRLAIGAHGGQILDEDFGADVTLTARFTLEHLPAFEAALRELSNGQLGAEIIETDEATIIPIGESEANDGAD